MTDADRDSISASFRHKNERRRHVGVGVQNRLDRLDGSSRVAPEAIHSKMISTRFHIRKTLYRPPGFA